MLITTALLKSLNGIATRRRTFKAGQAGKGVRHEYHMAAVGPKGIVHIFNGRNGTVRKISAVDQALTDWEPFQEVPVNRRIWLKKDQLEETPVELTAMKPKKTWKPKKAEPAPAEPADTSVCARCDQPSDKRHYISMTKWMCDACVPRPNR